MLSPTTDSVNANLCGVERLTEPLDISASQILPLLQDAV